MTLSGRAALVTGGRRLGAEVAVALAGRGADVAIVYRSSAAEADATADEVRAQGRRAALVHADLSQPDACARAVQEAQAALGRVDVLVNMASVYRSLPFDELTLEDWEAPMAVDLRASYLCAKAVVPAMRRQGGGRIVNFADWVAASGRPRYDGYLPYYVAKQGVIALTEALALELAPDGILVNAVAPGPIVAPPGTSEDDQAAVARATPLGRWGGAQAVVTTVLFLIETDFMTGETVRVDGGRHLR